MSDTEKIDYGTFEATVERSRKLEEDLAVNPHKYRVLTGDRPTGRLHIGHLFGSIQNRVRLNKLGVETFIVIADYQVLTDRDTFDSIAENVKQLTIDYLAAGIDVEGEILAFSRTAMFLSSINCCCLFLHWLPMQNWTVIPQSRKKLLHPGKKESMQECILTRFIRPQTYCSAKGMLYLSEKISSRILN